MRRTMAGLGIWFVGARGSLATTATVGAAALGAGLVESTGCVTEHPDIDARGLAPYDAIVVGGHDVVNTPVAKRVEQLVAGGVVPAALVPPLSAELDAVEGRLRPGIDRGPGGGTNQRAEVEGLGRDIRAFAARDGRTVVIDVSSTEQPHEAGHD